MCDAVTFGGENSRCNTECPLFIITVSVILWTVLLSFVIDEWKQWAWQCVYSNVPTWSGEWEVITPWKGWRKTMWVDCCTSLCTHHHTWGPDVSGLLYFFVYSSSQLGSRCEWTVVLLCVLIVTPGVQMWVDRCTSLCTHRYTWGPDVSGLLYFFVYSSSQLGSRCIRALPEPWDSTRGSARWSVNTCHAGIIGDDAACCRLI